LTSTFSRAASPHSVGFSIFSTQPGFSIQKTALAPSVAQSQYECVFLSAFETCSEAQSGIGS
jgi:hypothetical protein